MKNFSKKYWPWIVSLVVILIVGIGAYFWLGGPIRDHQIRKVKLGDKELKVEVVKEMASIVQGLSGREELPKDGMLFILPNKDRHGFWMKDMKFNLDMVWISDGEVVEITENVPAPSSPQEELPIVAAGVETEMVLEMGAGEAARQGVAVGDKLTIK